VLDRGNYFSGQSRDEKIVLFVRRHWMAFAPWALITFILLIIPIIAYFYIYSTVFGLVGIYWIIVIYSIYYLSVLAIFLNSWLNYYLNTTIVTTDHLVDIRQNGLFNRQVAEQSLLRVQDVSSRMKGILQTFFRYGRVFVETAGDTPNFELNNVPRPYKVANTIIGLHQDLIKNGSHQRQAAEAEGELNYNGNNLAEIENICSVDKDNNNSIGNEDNIYLNEFDKFSNKPEKNVEKSSQNMNDSGQLEDGKIIKF
jgi:uncharacterized membrane protein YdbT with pleckstrin-like domain